MKRLFYLVLAALTVSLTACDLADAPQIDANDLVGNWILFTIGVEPIDNTRADVLLVEPDGQWSLHGNTVDWVATPDWRKYEDLSYSVDGNIITVQGTAAKKMDFKVQVLMLTPNTLTVRVKQVAGDNELNVTVGSMLSFYRADAPDYSVEGTWMEADSLEQIIFDNEGLFTLSTRAAKADPFALHATCDYFVYGDLVVTDNKENDNLYIMNSVVREDSILLTQIVTGEDPYIWEGTRVEED